MGRGFVITWTAMIPTLLHIYARHGTRTVAAADVFFQGQAVWNETRKRFEKEEQGA